MLEEATNRRPAAIACCCRIRSLRLYVIQEARHRISVDVAELQGSNPSAALLSNELE